MRDRQQWDADAPLPSRVLGTDPTPRRLRLRRRRRNPGRHAGPERAHRYNQQCSLEGPGTLTDRQG